MSRLLWAQFADSFRRTALPLVSYYVVTLALPLANGAAHGGRAFAEHALMVAVVPPLAIVIVCAVGTLARALRPPS